MVPSGGTREPDDPVTPRRPVSRQPRLDLPHVAQHIVQRGNDRQPCFFDDADYRRYLIDLLDAAQRFGVAIHAYVLMSNHAHLLATASDHGGISAMMQLLGRRYVPYVNKTYQRTGTLWEGRYKSCLVDSERYLWNCHRYIELNPVRAGLVAKVGDYPWSSFRGNALADTDPTLTPHRQYLALAATAAGRRVAYRALFREGLDRENLAEIRAHLQQQRAWGSASFQDEIGSRLGRCAQVRPAHRPGKTAG